MSGSLIGDVLEQVVDIERMRSHRCITCLERGGQFDGDRRQFAALLAATFQREANGVRMRHAAVEHLADAICDSAAP
jgi:hypothetical protein